jgi:ribosomal protein S18 acetylase RimI-like enzyme
MAQTPGGGAPGDAQDLTTRPLRSSDRPAVARLLDDAVGPGFWAFDGSDEALSLVTVHAGGVAGVVLARLAPADDRDAQTAVGLGEPSPGAATDPVLHVRMIAVAPEARRSGLARRLLAAAEAEASSQGTKTAFLYAWLPAGRPEPFAVRFYEAAGYTAGDDIAGFYAEGSDASGAVCPYCGDPPCRCAARPFVKRLAAPA